MKLLHALLAVSVMVGCGIDEDEGIDVSEDDAALTASPTCLETCGDVNADRKITVTDSVLIGRYAAGLDNPSTCKLRASDVNGDGRVSVTDQVLVQSAAAGITDSRTFRCPAPILFGPLTKI